MFSLCVSIRSKLMRSSETDILKTTVDDSIWLYPMCCRYELRLLEMLVLCNKRCEVNCVDLHFKLKGACANVDNYLF